MAGAEGGGAFATDLGYLDKFLDKLERHAAGMTDAAAKGQLAGLLAQERARWAEIRALLAGRAPPAEAAGSGTTPAARDPERPAPPGFTVGSLVKGR